MRKDNLHILSYSVSYKIFQEQFNIGFGNSKSDVCYFCEEVENRIKTANSPAENATIMWKFSLHKLRAKTIYEF